jgi:ATP-dependent RNA helicase SUPV3L1/SUV3
VRYNEQRREREPRNDRNERRQRMERQSQGFAKGSGGKPSDTKRDHGRPGGEGRDGQSRGPRRGRERDQVDRADRDKYYARPGGGSGGRDKAPDPNSPFAKLAALKSQLESKD